MNNQLTNQSIKQIQMVIWDYKMQSNLNQLDVYLGSMGNKFMYKTVKSLDYVHTTGGI